MSQNPFQAILKTYEIVAQSIQTQLSRHFFNAHSYHQGGFPPPVFSISSTPPNPPRDSAILVQPKEVLSDPGSSAKGKSVVPLTKEELGRATWTLLHTIAAQFPDHPTRQQKRDVKELMAILSRLYPCKECADHFKEVLKVHPVQAGSQHEFSQWLCQVHNVVNRSLGKLSFPCQRVNARWGKLDCKDRACDLQDTSSGSSN